MKNSVKLLSENIIKCDLCGFSNSKLFLQTEDHNYGTGLYNYVICRQCGLIWLNPRPKKKFLKKYYPLKYPAYQKLKNISRFQKIFRKIINKHKFLARLFIKDQLYFDHKKGRLLDVGTGNGNYLSVLQSWGWDAYGIEINPEAVKSAKKSGLKKIFQGTVFSHKFPANYFDVIRYSHVIEHVLLPKKELQKVFNLLKPGGKVIIDLPNINSIFFQIFRQYWYPLETPRHLWQFSDKTIESLLLRTGFEKINIHYIQPSKTFIWSLKLMVSQSNVESKPGIIGNFFSLFLKITTIFKKSDILEVTAYKNSR